NEFTRFLNLPTISTRFHCVWIITLLQQKKQKWFIVLSIPCRSLYAILIWILGNDYSEVRLVYGTKKNFKRSKFCTNDYYVIHSDQRNCGVTVFLTTKGP